MLLGTFITSTALLALIAGFLASERHRSAHTLSRLRQRLDTGTVWTVDTVHDGIARVIHFFRSDVVLKGLHLITYIALVCVRFLERWLVRTVHLLRSFRKERIPRSSTHKLAQTDRRAEHVAPPVRDVPGGGEVR